MDEVLDITDIVGERGFLPSSSDDEEETAQISKVKATLSSRLANIFGEGTSSNLTSGNSNASSDIEKSPPPTSATIFSSVVDLYLPESSSASVSKASRGRVGMAVIRNSNKSDLLVFYNANKETILLVPLGPGNISEIKKSQRFLVVTSASKRFLLLCSNSDDEFKIIALLMILCSIDSVDIEVGNDDEVQNGSVIRYEAKSFVFDHANIKDCPEEQLKMRLSATAEPWAMRLLGMRKSAKRMVRKDEKSVVLVHVKKIKIPTKKQDNSISASTTSAQETPAADLETENDVSKEQQSDHEKVRKRMASIGLSILPTESLPMRENFSSRSGTYSPQPDISEALEPQSEVSAHSSLNERTGDSLENSQAVHIAEKQKEEQDHPSMAQGSHSKEPVDGFLALQRIVGVEIDRLEIRLEAALERMIDRHMNSLREEMREIKERQEFLLKKIEQL